MIFLRVFGAVFALLVLWWNFNTFRQGKNGRMEFVFIFLVGLFVLSVSFYPPVSNILAEMIYMKDVQHKRILSLLIVSNFIFFFMLARYINQQRNMRVSFDLLVRNNGRESFFKTYENPKINSVLVVIPALNERENLTSLLPKIPTKVGSHDISVLVVDDGSSDGTAGIVEDAGFYVARNSINRGGGGALRLGYDIASHLGTDIIITMDADHQHDPAEIPSLLGPIIQGKADIVIGSRILGQSLTQDRIRYLGVHIFNSLIRFLTGINITDCSSGYRAFRLNKVFFLKLIQEQYHTSEFVIEAAKSGISITEVPITISPRLEGKSKKGSNLMKKSVSR